MNDRIKHLRQESLDAIPRVSIERASLLTEFYKSNKAQQVSIPVARALAFEYLLTNKSLCINDGELIVGERGEDPKATPTYPEICTHSLDDFNILNDRSKVSFSVNNTVRDTQHDTVIPFWSGRSLRDRIFEEMDPAWKNAYDSGLFTEFLEQRAPGHTVLDDKIYHKGMLDFKSDINDAIERLDFQYDPEALDKREQLRAMSISTDALIKYAERYAEELEQLAEQTSNTDRKTELIQLSQICRRVPAHAPQNFWEALQYYWFVHIGVITELNTWDSFNPGRLDQHLLPFYQHDIAAGTLTPEQARELLQSFWIKFNNQPAPPKVGVTAQESNTYTDFCLINIGGVKQDGSDGTNELSYLILDVIKEMRLLQPSSMVQISKKSPNRLLNHALEIIKTGYGQPSLFNTDAIIAELMRQGKTIKDARNGGASGCVEAGAFGKEAYILTGYFNIVKVLEITLHNGLDTLTNKKIGLETGDPASFETFEQFYSAFEDQLAHFINIKIKGNLIIERLWAKYLPAPFLSVLVDDCIANGTDYNAGGARYNSSYIQGVGLGSVTDCLAAIKFYVYDHPVVTLPRLVNVLRDNFVNDPELQQTLQNEAPKYGNDDKYPDDLARMVFESYFGLIDCRPNVRGGHHRINLLPTTCHIYFGSVVGAMPDGRASGTPLSEGISPVQGCDLQGPTAVMNSAARIDHLRTGGTLLNMKFTPQLLRDQDGLDKLAHLVRTYFMMDGHHVQFNVVTAETLRRAKKEPHKHRDLIVRVAGYSDYFVDLTDELQNEIIRRTEQGAL